MFVKKKRTFLNLWQNLHGQLFRTKPSNAFLVYFSYSQTVQVITYECTEQIFDSRLLMHNKILLKKLVQIVLVHICRFLLASFASKLINYSRHSECSNLRKSTISFRQLFIFVNFQPYFTHCGSSN